MKKLFSYVRAEIGLSAAFLSVIGSLLFGAGVANTIFAAAASFFVCSFVYSYNLHTDKDEDEVNRGVHPLVSGKGLAITAGLFVIGLCFALLLPWQSIVFYASSALTGVIYSRFRLKKHFLVKNLYTGLGLPQVFLIGAFSAGVVAHIMDYYLLLAGFIFAGSLLTDLRDHEGDMRQALKTLPVILAPGIRGWLPPRFWRIFHLR